LRPLTTMNRSGSFPRRPQLFPRFQIASKKMPAPRRQKGIAMMQGLTAVCRQCNKRFQLSRYSNRFRRAGSTTIKSTRFCGPACRQAAWRKRNAERPKSSPGTSTHRAVTRDSQIVENAKKIRASKTVLDAEIYARHRWEDRVNSSGVPIQVAQLHQSTLVRP
jgi:hypothetical protein